MRKSMLALCALALSLCAPVAANAACPTDAGNTSGVDSSIIRDALKEICSNTGSQARGSTFAPAVTALSTSAAIVLAAGSTYVARIVCNDDAAITEYIGGSGVTSAGANGVRLLAGQCWDVSHTTAAVYAVAASGTPNARGVQY